MSMKAVCCLVLLAVSFQCSQAAGLRGHQRELLSHLLHENEPEPAQQESVAGEHDFGGFPAPYIVKLGDSLSSIAEDTSSSVDDVRYMNAHLPLPQEDDATVTVGLAINVPGFPGVPPLPTTIAVRDSQALDFFRLAYNINMEAMQKINKIALDDINKLTTVHVPLPVNYPEIECPSSVICVKAAQSLADVAQESDVDVEALLASNPQVLKQGGRLYVGQLLSRPGVEPVSVDRMVTFHARQNPYHVLLTTMGLPITVPYLSNMAAANEKTIDDLLIVRNKMSLWETQDISKSAIQIPVLSSSCNEKKTTAERRKLAETRGRGLTTTTTVNKVVNSATTTTADSKSATVNKDITKTKTDGVTTTTTTKTVAKTTTTTPAAYGGRKLMDGRAAPVLSRLHFGEPEQLVSDDATSEISAPARALRHVLHPSKAEEAEEMDSISNAASRLFNMLHEDEAVPAGRKLQSMRGRHVQELQGHESRKELAQ